MEYLNFSWVFFNLKYLFYIISLKFFLKIPSNS